MGFFDFFKKNKTEAAGSGQESVGRKGFQAYTGQGVCDVCNRPLGGGKAYLVPNDIFYASPKWRQLQKNNIRMMTGMVATDADIDRIRMMDQSQGSAVCENCIHMFR